MPTELGQFDTILFDCDGVLWRGATEIPGAKRTIQSLRALNKRLFFVTNNSTKSRIQYAKKFKEKLGLTVNKDDIFPVSYASVAYLKSIGFHKRSRAERNKVYVVGMRGILDELKEAGIPYIWCEDVAPPSRTPNALEMAAWKPDPAIGAVLTGLTWRFTFAMSAYACRVYRSHPDNIFVCTNRDSTFIMPPNIILPGGGSVVSSVETGLQAKPINCGKPEKLLFDLVNQAAGGLELNRTLMIGDRLDTDILFGQRSKIRTLLVFSGVTIKEDYFGNSEDGTEASPTYWLDSVADLVPENQRSHL